LTDLKWSDLRDLLKGSRDSFWAAVAMAYTRNAVLIETNLSLTDEDLIVLAQTDTEEGPSPEKKRARVKMTQTLLLDSMKGLKKSIVQFSQGNVIEKTLAKHLQGTVETLDRIYKLNTRRSLGYLNNKEW